MSEHTKEPFHADGPEILAEDETLHISTCWNHDKINPDTAEANARRIVACVNACAGIPTESLEAHTIHQMCAQLREEIKAEYYRPGSD